MIHHDLVEAHELALPFCRTEQPKSLEPHILVPLVDGMPRRLEVGHVLFHPIVIHDLAGSRRDGAVGVVDRMRRGLGELLPFQCTIADGRTEGHRGAFAGVVKLAAWDGRLGRWHKVVRCRADRRGRSREEEGGGIGIVVVVGRLYPGWEVLV